MDGLDDVEFAWIKKEEKDTSETPKAKKRDGFTLMGIIGVGIFGGIVG